MSIKDDKINLILSISKEKVIHYEFHGENINRAHKSKRIKKFFIKNNLKIITNVPYESSFNSVEL